MSATLSTVDGQKIPSGKDFDSATGKLKKPNLLQLNETEANELAARLQTSQIPRSPSVEVKPFTERPRPPFTTSTLQQEANRKLGFAAQRTMSAAQRLYENGYITYMRTDSTTLSKEAIGAARNLVRSEYGEQLSAPGRPGLQRQGQERPGGPRGDSAGRNLLPLARNPPWRTRFRSVSPVRHDLEANGRLPNGRCQEATGEYHRSKGAARRSPPAEPASSSRASCVLTSKGSDDPEAELANRDKILPLGQAGRSTRRHRTGSQKPHHAASGPFHRSDIDQDAGGERDRPTQYLCVDHRHDHRRRTQLHRQEGHGTGSNLASIQRHPFDGRPLLHAGRLRVHGRTGGLSRFDQPRRGRARGVSEEVLFRR